MVGDSLASDIAGGRAAGMFTIWINGKEPAPSDHHADLTIQSLGELHRIWSRSRVAANGQARPRMTNT